MQWLAAIPSPDTPPAVTQAMEALRTMFDGNDEGVEVPEGRPVRYFVTRWAGDRFSRGSYSRLDAGKLWGLGSMPLSLPSHTRAPSFVGKAPLHATTPRWRSQFLATGTRRVAL